ncbi:hypothetical protein [Bradyrhizobium sp. LMTR 3]|uniref:hypothetical protein n=1 Tax=Bradyrhizobium sp. LMTR 3 TaxID=189873 RepID=UPI0011475BEC|nr:hypothetical protein [Bradyrhizobium sp. LMTR 3]
MVQMHRDHAARLAAVWGCQRAGKYAIKGRLFHVTQPWFVFRGAHAVSYSWLLSVLGVRSIVGTTVCRLFRSQAFRLSVTSNFCRLQMVGHSLNKPMSAEEAEAETRHQFAVRANSILAFIECDEEQRPKLREAIIESMLWAQTQPKLTK